MTQPDEQPHCDWTDAVLAQHLDGDVDRGDADRGDAGRGDAGSRVIRDSGGASTAGDDCDSVQTHLHRCAVCRQALLRARRLDAALAASAGRAIGDHLAAGGGSLPQLADRWFAAAELAAAPASAEPLAPRQHPPSRSDSAGSDTAGSDTAGNDTTEQSRWVDALAAAALVLAGSFGFWCLTLAGKTESVDEVASVSGTATASATTAPSDATAPVAVELKAVESGGVDAPPIAPAIPVQMASQLRDAHRAARLAAPNRSSNDAMAPGQRAATAAELRRRIAAASVPFPARIAAGRRLVSAARPGSPGSRRALSALLEAMAECGNRTASASLLHDELLDLARGASFVGSGCASRLTQLTVPQTLAAESLEATDLAAVVVSARIGESRLDHSLRRLLRRHCHLADTVAAALRCDCRVGTAKLLLACWGDQVALGRQTNSQEWAEFWFRGQPRGTFDEAEQQLAKTSSSEHRVRCLLALGCVADSSTLALLQQHLESPRRAEALAAACGIASLPHRVIKPLLADARRADADLLRAALARAGLPATDAWLDSLGLNRPQRALARQAALPQFGQVANWFRGTAGIAD